MADKGVFLELDFAALDGAEILYETTEQLFGRLDIAFDRPIEARYLAGATDLLQGLKSYFTEIKTKKTPQKAAKDLNAAFVKALNEALPSVLTVSFRNFINTLLGKDVRPVLLTRANVELVRPAFEAQFGDAVTLLTVPSSLYGSYASDAWLFACAKSKLRRPSSLAVTGSGFSTKSALLAGLGSMAVIKEHVSYQDFSGANAVVSELSAPAARKVLSLLHV